MAAQSYAPISLSVVAGLLTTRPRPRQNPRVHGCAGVTVIPEHRWDGARCGSDGDDDLAACVASF